MFRRSFLDPTFPCSYYPTFLFSLQELLKLIIYTYCLKFLSFFSFLNLVQPDFYPHCPLKVHFSRLPKISMQLNPLGNLAFALADPLAAQALAAACSLLLDQLSPFSLHFLKSFWFSSYFSNFSSQSPLLTSAYLPQIYLFIFSYNIFH